MECWKISFQLIQWWKMPVKQLEKIYETPKKKTLSLSSANIIIDTSSLSNRKKESVAVKTSEQQREDGSAPSCYSSNSSSSSFPSMKQSSLSLSSSNSETLIKRNWKLFNCMKN